MYRSIPFTRPEKAGIRESDISLAEVEHSSVCLRAAYRALVKSRVCIAYMAKTKAEKGVVIDKLVDAFKNSTSSVLVHFSKVTVAEESAMRRSLRQAGVIYFVAKKTLIRRALEQLGHKHDALALDGEIAVAYGGEGDSTAAARLVHDFTKKLTDRLSIVGGIFEGALVSEAAMREIATIPSMDVLRGMFAQIINSPRSRFAIALSEVAKTKN